MDIDAYRDVDGVRVHSFIHENLVRSALSYKPRADEVLVVTYPKCGTTWTQYLILSILSKGHPPSTVRDFLLASPYLEMMGAESVEKMPRPGVIKTHLPFHKRPYSEQAKYIYVARNPYDVCVSFYYHLKSMTPKTVEDVSFAKFHDLFLGDKLSYGAYFDHLLPWYEHRNDPNVLFVTYEKLKEETKAWTLKIANFMDAKYERTLREDQSLAEKVVDAASFINMRLVFKDALQTIMQDLLSLSRERTYKSLEVYRNMVTHWKQMHDATGFVRKGVVGDWRRHFTPQQIKKTKSWIAENTKGSDVMDLWKDIDLP